MLYLWIKALHIVALISWMATLLYLPRLFVYHCGAPVGAQQSETFKLMERRLLRQIGNPAMIVTWLAGLYLLYEGGWIVAGWMHAKLLLVLGLSAFHGLQAKWLREFADDRRDRSARFFRMVNEIPALLMVGIVVLVVVKPF
ncbi:protoporphyrinogen oxidase HemJ [Aquabacter spiritensis]|uniref:Protoporphyrinogen IX oxidase n=1 Tax=Aquabacter spiritensis TaxID=933073 RepID=A0A4R3LZ55_9HYPH|nr:protoporphyrinogen oxidase HemJ [Aquabacter spiritensis]TCT05962.1 putative membrane protein [Aquabacter spiritensis]